jgi:hypothetical protein
MNVPNYEISIGSVTYVAIDYELLPVETRGIKFHIPYRNSDRIDEAIILTSATIIIIRVPGWREKKNSSDPASNLASDQSLFKFDGMKNVF